MICGVHAVYEVLVAGNAPVERIHILRDAKLPRLKQILDLARERDVNVLNLVGSRLSSPNELEAPAKVMFDLLDPAMLDGLVVFSEMLYHFVSVSELKEFLKRYGAVPMTSILAQLPLGVGAGRVAARQRRRKSWASGTSQP